MIIDELEANGPLEQKKCRYAKELRKDWLYESEGSRTPQDNPQRLL